MDELSAHIMVVINSTINVVLHLFGIYLLLATKIKRSNKSVNHIYLINLSFSTLLKNVAYIGCSGLKIMSIFDASPFIQKFYIYALYMVVPLVYSLCYVAMLVLIGDRLFLALYGSSMYLSSSWDRSRGKSLLFLLWVLIVVVFVVMYEVVGIFHGNIRIVAMYIVTLMNLICIAFVVSLYIAVYNLLQKTNGKVHATLTKVLDIEKRDEGKQFSFQEALGEVPSCLLEKNSEGKRIVDQSKYGYTLRDSPFYTTVLLASSFLVLVIVPSISLSICSILRGFVQEDLLLAVHITTSLSDTATGLIYILTYQSLFKLFRRSLHQRQGWCCCCFPKSYDHESYRKTIKESELIEEESVMSHDCSVILRSYVNEYNVNSPVIEESQVCSAVSASQSFKEDTKREKSKNGPKSYIKQKNISVTEQFLMSHTKKEKRTSQKKRTDLPSYDNITDESSSISNRLSSESCSNSEDDNKLIFTLAFKNHSEIDYMTSKKSTGPSKKKTRLPSLKRKRIVPLSSNLPAEYCENQNSCISGLGLAKTVTFHGI